MKKTPAVRLLIAAVIYTAMYVLGSSCGLIHPACYAYVGTFMPILFSFMYLYAAVHLRAFGAAAVLNGLAIIVSLISGEWDPALIIGMIVLTLLSELLRRINGYETLKGVRRSFIPFAFSFYAYSAHWWIYTEKSLEAAAEEMPAGYADKMEIVIHNIPVLVLMLVLTIPVAILGMRIAEKVLKKQTASLR